jgi:hypothetical protein
MSRLLILLALVGCEQHYRYPCQNPENWENKECQKPICEVNQDCPDQIFSDQKRMEPWINKGMPISTDTKETDKGGRNDCAK